MKKTTAVMLSAVMAAASLTGCGDKKSSGSSKSNSSSSSAETASADSDEPTENITTTQAASEAPTTKHVSPVESVTSDIGVQVDVGKNVSREEGNNTLKLPLSDFIEDGDIIKSFTFEIDRAGTESFKGGFGLSVNGDCPAATDEGWYQSENMEYSSEGSYLKIVWEVPADVGKYAASGGEVLFGYWWGNDEAVSLERVTCTFSRTKDIPVDGGINQRIEKSVNFNDSDNTISVPAGDFMPDNCIPQAVTYKISSNGSFGKFTGAFGISSDSGSYLSPNISVFTDSSSLELTWLVPEEAKKIYSKNGDFTLGYWWSEQDTASLDSILVRYSLADSDSSAPQVTPPAENSTKPAETNNSDFRSSADIVKDIKVGWNLGNSLESYKTNKSGLQTETGWGNPKTTEDMIKSVKNAGFNAIRIPVTWGEHMDGDTIQSEWLDRAQEVVDYAYDQGLYVIINMHHDDYIWFEPEDSEYSGDSAKLKAIWKQVADRFNDYGDRLLFEGMNEPRTVGSNNEWTGGTPEERKVVNKYEQDFVDTVRSTGGNNAFRTLVITSYAASAEDQAMNDIIVPDDDHIIVSLHYYAPWKFSDGQTTEFGDKEKTELENKFAKMKSKFIDNGTPLIIGEFGCVSVADDSTRADYYSSYISIAKNYGIKCFIWDNGIGTGKNYYGIFNRGALTWNETILNALISAAQ